MKTINSKGFTVVELLIVIVVIAILAAVSIVAYNGVQIRAENTKTIQGVERYVKALKSYAASNGNYPNPSSYGLPYTCLGSTGSVCGTVSGSVPCFGIGYATGLAGFTQHMTTPPDGILTTMPELSKQSMSCSTTGPERAGGALYITYDQGATVYIYYYLRGNTACGSPSGSSTASNFISDTTLCLLTLTSG